MNLRTRFLLSIFSAAGIAICIPGCAMLPKEKIAGTSTDYNLIVEKVQNEVLLLNIVRSSKRRPIRVDIRHDGIEVCHDLIGIRKSAIGQGDRQWTDDCHD